ncbi:hypothetical protein AB0N23_06860 [Streptomyces sp. NPDC052644]
MRCPAIEHPDPPLADPAALGPLLARLAAADPVAADETYPLGTLRADGRIDLCKQGLGPDGAARLLPAAAASPHAAHLLLGTNGIGDDGARTVAEALRPGHGLRTLYLGCNRVGPAGAAALARALPGSPLRTLELRHTGLTGRGAKALLAAVPDDSALEYVGLGPGLPRRVKRDFRRRVRPARPAHPDLRAIGSVHR